VIVAASSITFQVRQLQKKGLIQRRRSDARTWRVSLTPLGETKRKSAAQKMDAIIGEIRMSSEAITAAKAALNEVHGRLAELVHGIRESRSIAK
jgi:DNA-binding MarR family transcriptional regulator